MINENIIIGCINNQFFYAYCYIYNIETNLIRKFILLCIYKNMLFIFKSI